LESDGVRHPPGDARRANAHGVEVSAPPERETVTGALKHGASAVASVSVVAVLAGLGFPAVAAAAGLVVLVLGVVCWVLSSNERSDRFARISLGIRGNAGCLYAADGSENGAPPPAPGAPATRSGHGIGLSS
jgi:hypothetical protein